MDRKVDNCLSIPIPKFHAQTDKQKLRIKRRYFWGCGIGLFVIFLIYFVASNFLFIKRAITYPYAAPITQTSWYQPVDTIYGASKPLQLPLSTAPIPQKAIDQALSYAQKNRSSAFLLLHQGKLAVEKYWRGFTPHSNTNSMSMAKTLTGLLVGIAIDEGQLPDENTRVAELLPEWRNDGRRQITIKHLLQMTSGLRNRNSQNNPFSDLLQMHLGKDALAVALNLPLKSAPGKTFDYNNANTIILAHLIEKQTGKRFAEYLTEKLWKPLGAERASVWLDHQGGMAKAYCCILATPMSWARVGQLILEEGRFGAQTIVPKRWIQKMVTPSASNPNYGYQIWLQNPPKPSQISKHRIFRIDGQDKQLVYIMPDQKIVMVRVGEKPASWDLDVLPQIISTNYRPASIQQRSQQEKTNLNLQSTL